MLCPICTIRSVSNKTSKTCGDEGCKTTMSQQTKDGKSEKARLVEMRLAYGDDNPWTQWMRQQIAKRDSQ